MVKLSQYRYTVSENQSTFNTDVRVYIGVVERSVSVKLLIGNDTSNSIGTGKRIQLIKYKSRIVHD